MPTPQQTSPYTTGQQVEVFRQDFKVPGFPHVWHSATVEAVTNDGDHGLFDVTLRLADGTANVQRVGKRGGNKNLRAA